MRGGVFLPCPDVGTDTAQHRSCSIFRTIYLNQRRSSSAELGAGGVA